MIATIVHRVRLPAHQSSPAAARAAVRAVITESGLDLISDEALLLTTELATNGVVHAGTDLELEIVADADSLTVTVMDFRSGPLTFGEWATARRAATDGRPVSRRRSPDELDERGRGLLLVDQLASCWGTLHHPTGKGVWFRLDRPGSPSPPVTGQAVVGAPARRPHAPAGASPARPTPVGDPVAATAAVLTTLVGAGNTGTEHGTLAVAGDDLLRRVCGALGAWAAVATVDEGDGSGPQQVASYGAAVWYQAANSPDTLRVPLRLSRPWRGELRFTGVDRPGDGAPVSPATALAGPVAELAAEWLSLLVENSRLRSANSERRGWLTFLAEASQLLAQSLDVELTLALIPRLVVPRLGRWCAVHTTDTAGRLRLAAVAHADESQVAALTEALAEAGADLVEALRGDAVVPLTAPVEGYVVALLARGQQLGTLSVGRGLEHWQGSEEVAVVEDVARRAALAIDNARIHAERRSIAQTLQRSLLPPQLPKVQGVDFGAEYVPTGEGADVGGDFYDVVILGEDRWLVMVGDVSGKGVHAATVTGLVRDVTRVLVRDGRTLPEALARLNETLVERGAGRFCTLALAAVTRRADGLLDVTLHLAGHDKPVLIAADGATSLVGTCGTALGLLDRVLSPATQVRLGPGDTLVFYTDGVTERRRGTELFGVDRLCVEAGLLAGFPAEVVAARLRAATLSYSPEEPRDDIAIFAVRNDAGS
ncbi:MAG TPA: SpoIIE family protein phosphatase [Micromonosporaceae bacterium]|nr:SpoIIE family protein phosphatase [Micromonosporaceae bacterium]